MTIILEQIKHKSDNENEIDGVNNSTKSSNVQFFYIAFIH